MSWGPTFGGHFNVREHADEVVIIKNDKDYLPAGEIRKFFKFLINGGHKNLHGKPSYGCNPVAGAGNAGRRSFRITGG